MREKDFSRIVNNPRHISGIHNYCDRWCQRCPFTLRCSVFAVEQAERRGAEPHDKAMEDLWPRLKTFEPAARELIAARADHPGVGAAKEPKFKDHDRPVDSHPVGVASKRYMEFAHKFLNEREKELAGKTEAGALAVSVAEAIEVIGWFHMLIMVKLSRALSQREFDEEMGDDPEMADMPRDQDGSAKISLIGIDLSIFAWTALLQHDASFAYPANSAILTLHRLRTAAERHFPKARGFVRVGFDTHRFPDRKK